jgi:hypothetical protein
MTQKRQTVILVVLLAIAGNIWYWSFFRQKTAEPAGTVSVAQNPELLSVENPQLHKDKIDLARRTEYKSNGRNIFSPIAPPPPEKSHAPRPDPSGPKQDPPIPTPPPPTLPVKFFGYGTVPNGTARRAFFTDGEDVYIVSEGEVLLNRFRILKVGNASLDFEEVSSGRHGTAALEEQGATPSA